MKRRLVLVVPALLVLAGCGHAVVVEPAAATSSARSSSTPAPVVDDPCLPGDPSCSAPAPIPEAPAPAAGSLPHATPQTGKGSAGVGPEGGRPHRGAATAAPPPVVEPAPVCDPETEDVDTDSPTGCITRQLPEETTGRAYG